MSQNVVLEDDNAKLPAGFTFKEEIVFLVGEIRSAQSQAGALLAAAIALLALADFVVSLSQGWKIAIVSVSVISLATAGFYFISSLRVAGISVKYDDGVYVRLRKLRAITRRAYVTRTVCGLLLFAVLVGVLVCRSWAWMADDGGRALGPHPFCIGAHRPSESTRHHHIVPQFDHRLVHVAQIIERAKAVFDDVAMVPMVVGSKPGGHQRPLF
jgi:hypothetical protein